MIVTVVLEKEDYAAIHGVVLSVTGHSFTNDQLQTIWDNLPEDIKGTAIEWGCDDTVFRDNLYEHLEEEVKQAEKDLKKKLG